MVLRIQGHVLVKAPALTVQVVVVVVSAAYDHLKPFRCVIDSPSCPRFTVTQVISAVPFATEEPTVFPRRRTTGAPGRGRAFVQVTATLGVVALVASGCSDAAKKDASPTSGASGKPVPGDTLTVGLQAPATSINPATINTAFVTYTQLAYEPLTYRTSEGAIEPALASSWKYVGDDNKQFDMTIRSGVDFADGTPVDAKAVKASLDYVRGAKGSNSQFLAMVRSIEVTGPQKISIKLSESNPMLPEMLSQSYGIGSIISPAGLKNPKKLTVQEPSHGAGAYVFDPKGTVAGDHYAYTANPRYYDKSKQHYKKVVVKVIANPQAALNAVKTGQVDAIAGDASTSTQAKKSGLQIAETPFVWSGLNLIDRGGEVSKPLGELKVRQAINYAIDRKTLSEALVGDYGSPTNTTVVKGSDAWSQEAEERYPYDPAKAKKLLSEAGYPEGFELKVLSIRFAGIDKTTEALQPQLEKVGIRIKPTYVTDEQSYVTKSTDKSFPATTVGYGAQPMYLMGQGLFLPGAMPFNGFKTESPELSKMYADAAAAPPQERKAIDQKMQKWLVDNAWFAPVAFTPVFYYAKPDLGGVKVSAKAPVATALDWYETE